LASKFEAHAQPVDRVSTIANMKYFITFSSR
jgi:hypothetical protein